NRLPAEGSRISVAGRVLLDGRDLYDRDIDPAEVRRRIGLLAQQPNPLITRTIEQNVSIGLELNGVRRVGRKAPVEEALRQAALWDEVKDRLNQPATSLSIGQQQRLCLARALVCRPEIMLMDEPASALDPIATSRIEALIRELAGHITVIIVTHNMRQAAGVSDYTVVMSHGDDGAGRVVEAGTTEQIFAAPQLGLTKKYIAGRGGRWMFDREFQTSEEDQSVCR
ncbi:MAG TPA: ATP-binding cassette domain-containing protein, partial [Thermomicrobiaceae bacterium]|nr:ATP-binding cassette domain-containing protein [Thermomicrobiaceae bacterium]